MWFRAITTGLFVISGTQPLGESAAMYRRLSSLRKSSPVVYLGRPPQTGLSTVRVYPWIRAVSSPWVSWRTHFIFSFSFFAAIRTLVHIISIADIPSSPRSALANPHRRHSTAGRIHRTSASLSLYRPATPPRAPVPDAPAATAATSHPSRDGQ